MKKVISLFTALIILTALCVPCFAADNIKVNVTIANGTLVLTNAEITVTDTDGDGKLTINDALYAAHEKAYKGGAAAGYGSAATEYGLSLTKLWGVENGGSYGYYVNNASALSLSDEIKAGDHINAFVYTDTTAWSDAYVYFDAFEKSAKEGGEVTLTLNEVGFDLDWNTVALPVEGASILIDGKDSGVKTNEKGKATITLDKAGTYTVSASKEGKNIVPPVCALTVSAAQTAEQPNTEPPKTGDAATVAVAALALVSGAGALAFTFGRRKIED